MAGKHDGPTKLGFALLLKFYGRYGRFPRGRAELRDEVVEFVAAQVKVPEADLGLYAWDGPTIKRSGSPRWTRWPSRATSGCSIGRSCSGGAWSR